MKKSIGLLATAGFICLPAIANAAAPDLGEVLTSTGIVAQGHLSASYTAGLNDGDTLAGRVTDTNANTFAFNQAGLNLAYQPTEGFGGFVSLLAGNDAKVVNAAYGTGGDNFALMQGYLQYAHGPLTVIAGRYGSLAGAEVIDDSLDANISRAFIYQLAQPFFHTGLRASYKVTDTFTVTGGVNNSAYSSAAYDTDKTKTGELSFAYAPSTKLSMSLTDYYGVDSNVKNNYLDALTTIQATDKLQVVLNGDWFRSVKGDLGVDTTVYGFAGYLNYSISDTWRASLRGEWLRTKNNSNFDPCAASSCGVSEATFTLGYLPTKHVSLLGEFRYDMGDHIYPDSSNLATDPHYISVQPEFSVKAIYTFGNAPST